MADRFPRLINTLSLSIIGKWRDFRTIDSRISIGLPVAQNREVKGQVPL